VCVESYDFLRQYELESGSRVCLSTLSSKILGCSPVDVPNLPYSPAGFDRAEHL